jgi:hypothetical protein
LKTCKSCFPFNANRDKCLCIGGAKNHAFLAALNNEHVFFKPSFPCRTRALSCSTGGGSAAFMCNNIWMHWQIDLIFAAPIVRHMIF